MPGSLFEIIRFCSSSFSDETTEGMISSNEFENLDEINNETESVQEQSKAVEIYNRIITIRGENVPVLNDDTTERTIIERIARGEVEINVPLTRFQGSDPCMENMGDLISRWFP